jgi:hypothetical protein
MFVINLFDEIKEEEALSVEPEYPDEVLESGWNPILAEAHPKKISEEQLSDSEPEED